MFPLKSNPLPWKRFSLRSKQGMDRKEQGACKWISEREQHLCKDDEAAAGQTRKLLEKSESAGDRGRPAEPLLPPKRGDGVRKARVCECSLKTPQVSLCDRSHDLQRLKYYLSGPLQKKSARSCSRTNIPRLPQTEIKKHVRCASTGEGLVWRKQAYSCYPLHTKN